MSANPALLIPSIAMIVLSFYFVVKELRKSKIYEENMIMLFYAFPFVGLTYILKTQGWFNMSLAITNAMLYTFACYFSMKPMFRWLKIMHEGEERETLVLALDRFVYRFYHIIVVSYAVFFGAGILLQSNILCRLPQVSIFVMTSVSLAYFVWFVIKERAYDGETIGEKLIAILKMVTENILFPAWLISWIEIVNFVYVASHYSQYNDWTQRNTYPDPLQAFDTIWILFCLGYYFVVPRFFMKPRKPKVK